MYDFNKMAEAIMLEHNLGKISEITQDQFIKFLMPRIHATIETALNKTVEPVAFGNGFVTGFSAGILYALKNPNAFDLLNQAIKEFKGGDDEFKPVS